MKGRGARPKGLAPGSLKAAIEAHATSPSPLALGAGALARVQVQFSTRGYEGLDDDALDSAVLHLWDVGACWDAWPAWAEARFPALVRQGLLRRVSGPLGNDIILDAPGMERICADANRAIDAAPSKPCVCVICAAAQLGRTMALPLERGAGL